MGYIGIEWVADTQDDDVAAWRRHGEREFPGETLRVRITEKVTDKEISKIREHE